MKITYTYLHSERDQKLLKSYPTTHMHYWKCVPVQIIRWQEENFQKDKSNRNSFFTCTLLDITRIISYNFSHVLLLMVLKIHMQTIFLWVSRTMTSLLNMQFSRYFVVLPWTIIVIYVCLWHCKRNNEGWLTEYSSGKVLKSYDLISIILLILNETKDHQDSGKLSGWWSASSSFTFNLTAYFLELLSSEKRRNEHYIIMCIRMYRSKT